MTVPPDDVPPESTAVPPDSGTPAPSERADSGLDDIGSLLAEIDALSGDLRSAAPVADPVVAPRGPAAREILSRIAENEETPAREPEPVSEPTPEPAPSPSPLNEVRRQVDEVLADTDADTDAATGPVAAGDPETHHAPDPEPSAEALPARPEPTTGDLPARDAVAPSSEDAPIPAPAAPSALREIDGSLADDAELLLQGNFDTVGEILDDPQEYIEDETSTPMPLEDEAEEPVDGEDETPAPIEEAADPPMAESVPLPARDPAPAASEVSEMIPERGGGETAPVAEDEPEPAVEEAPEPEPEPEIVVEPVPAATGPRWWSRFEPVAVTLLCLINVPLRFVPRRARPVVDWVALSLVFWVPIVWCVALLLIRA
ncbi:MAG: hypothetical protein GY715_07605 [Planctomycetes bacterium]|nr:hypothetical protein [Planctomycetota bacterium]